MRVGKRGTAVVLVNDPGRMSSIPPSFLGNGNGSGDFFDKALFGGWGSLGGSLTHHPSLSLATGGGFRSKVDISYKTEKAPKLVKQYVLGEVLGSGSYGKVREAVDSKTLRRVAIKILNKRYLRKIRGGEENVKREISIMKKLKRHPNVIELIEVIHDEEKEKLYMVLELVTGGSLQQLLEVSPYAPGRLPLGQARRYFRQLIAGLEHIHSLGIVHRDIKPSNLMITPEGILKISDFGVAELLDNFKDSDTLTKFSGSPAFQPPEIATGKERFSGYKVDVWAAGVTLYLTVTGKVPFDGGTVFELFEKIGSNIPIEIPPPVSENEKCCSLLRGMLRFDEEQRVSLREILAHEWLAEEDRPLAEEPWVMQKIEKRPTVLRYIAQMYDVEVGDHGSSSSMAEPHRDGDAVQGREETGIPNKVSDILKRIPNWQEISSWLKR